MLVVFQTEETSPRMLFRLFVWFLVALCVPHVVSAQSAESRRFSIGRGSDPTYHSFVMPLEGQKGIALDLIGGNAATLFPSVPWTTTVYHYNGTNSPGQSSTNTRIAYQNPIAAFGQRVGGSPLWTSNYYRFGVYAGSRGEDGSLLVGSTPLLITNILIKVYQKTNMAFLADVFFDTPSYSNSVEWTPYLTNAYIVANTSHGLTTYLTRDPSADWGVTPADWLNDGKFTLRHFASDAATNYVFLVRIAGWVKATGSPYGAEGMTTSSAGVPTDSRLYTIEFDKRPTDRASFLDLTHFEGSPLPPFYLGKSASM